MQGKLQNLIMSNKDKLTVCVVTVTYGNRLCFLSEVMRALEKQSYPLENVIVVDNGSKELLNEKLASFDLPINILKMYKNQGSAAGFTKGLLHALEIGPDLIWILDDDNKPSPSALEKLVDAFIDITNHNNANKIALSSQRIISGHGKRESKTNRQDRFLGFHILDSSKRFISLLHIFNKKTTSYHKKQIYGKHKLVPVRIAPYGGLLIPTSLVSQIGMPRNDFVTYGDDIEWTLRINNVGGYLYSCSDSIIYDIDKSWWMRNDKLNPIISPYTKEKIIYYSIRNQIYIEHQDTKNIILFLFNGLVRLSTLLINLAIYSKDKRTSLYHYFLLIRAIKDGIHGKLGHRTKYDKDY